MRRRIILHEVRGKVGIRAQQTRWGETRKPSEVTDQVGLIIVTALHGRIGPIRAGFFHGLQNVLETADTAKAFGCHAHGIEKLSFQLAVTKINPLRQAGHQSAHWFRSRYPRRTAPLRRCSV